MTSLLATNDFPPKVGGIQSYLHELWRRLPAAETTVFTTSYPGAAAWDAEQGFRVVRARQRFLLPTRRVRERVDSIAHSLGTDVVFVDPMLPLGAIGPRLQSAPYVVIAHGAEVTVYGRLPVSGMLGRKVLRHAAGIVAGGEYVAQVATRVAGRRLPTLFVPPGVDTEHFHPIDDDERAATRAFFGLPIDQPLVLGVSRLVPRKGFDVLIDAAAHLDDDVHLAIVGTGRDRKRLEQRAARIGDRVHFLGRVTHQMLTRLYASADVFAMLCRDRWRGLEAEGFGIVFLEAASCGVPVVAGRSGGSAEAVIDGETGFVVDGRDRNEVHRALRALIEDRELRARMGRSARDRVVRQFSYDSHAALLAPLAAGDFGVLRA